MHNGIEGASQMAADTAELIHRYMQIQREITALEQEKARLRGVIVEKLEGKAPPMWHSVIDGTPIVIVHKRKADVHYDEPLLRQRLGDKYSEILEIDGTKIRKNRELVRPLIASVLDQVGTPTAARVEAAIRSGVLPMEAFNGAFKKTFTPYISIRVEKKMLPEANVPY